MKTILAAVLLTLAMMGAASVGVRVVAAGDVSARRRAAHEEECAPLDGAALVA